MTGDKHERKLRKLGLTRYEAAAYLALLGEDGLTPTRVARKAGVPQPRVYGALSTLVERGFVEVSLSGSKTYRAVPPTVAYARHRQRTEKAFAESMDELATEMRELESAAPSAPTQDPAAFGIRLVRGAQQAERAFIATYEAAQSEILLFVKAPLRYAPVLDNDRELSRRGVKIKWLLERSILDNAEVAAGYHEFARSCGELRVRDSLPVKLAIIDRSLILVPLDDQDRQPTMLAIPNKTLAANMAEWFFDVWDRAEVVSTTPRAKTKAKTRA